MTVPSFRLSPASFYNVLLCGAMILTGCTQSVPPGGQADARTVSEVADRIATLCGKDDQPCMEKAIVALVADHGPELAMPVLTDLLGKKIMPGNSDYHDFVHKIGRATAKEYGVNNAAFMRCPLDYNYGCPHGFFEQALVEEPDAKVAAEKICGRENQMTSSPAKSFFYCYHGVGHGVMMAKAYDLQPSLDLCDGFAATDAIGGCHQGVFMENVVGQSKQQSREGVFSDADLLKPCNGLEKKYQHECYINHGGYLMAKTDNSVLQAGRECLRADGDMKHICLRAIGILVTNPGWQESLVSADQGSLVKNALHICKDFPKDYMEDCYGAGIDNLFNNYKTDVAYALEMCAALTGDYQRNCYGQMGVAGRREIPPGDPGTSICGQVPEQFQEICYQPFRT